MRLSRDVTCTSNLPGLVHTVPTRSERQTAPPVRCRRAVSDTLGDMSWPEPRTEAGRRALAAVLAHPRSTLLATDFDGVLAKIVTDPARAFADPAALAALERIGARIGQVVVITGRPAQTAVRLGRLCGRPGLGRLVVLGQYGVERWDAATDHFVNPPAPDNIEDVMSDIHHLLDGLGLAEAHVEDKGRAVGVHTRKLPRPKEALRRLRGPVAELAERHGYRVEPGKHVLELRAHGTDKGDALRTIVAETAARQVIYAGDDLGDLPAFEAVRAMQSDGVPALGVFSASVEEDTLVQVSDLVLQGVDGTAAWLSGLADALESCSGRA